MPQKNRRFPFVTDAYYHVYNRGANKQEIFFDNKDFRVFRNIIREKLMLEKENISLIAFCLMPNHYHFLFHQNSERAISSFVKSISIRYSMYMRKKYEHEGRLFSTSYHAILLSDWDAVKRVKQYILQNPVEGGLLNWPHAGLRV